MEQEFKNEEGNLALDDGFLNTNDSKSIIILSWILMLAYFIAVCFFFPVSNKILFYVLVLTEIFHLWQSTGLLYTIWDMNYMPPKTKSQPGVDVFITVAGEPEEIIAETVTACLRMDYPDFEVYVLNDGYVANKENWKSTEELVLSLGANCITRRIPGGAKAGNINNALNAVRADKHLAGKKENEFVAIFDADHMPHKNFLKEMMSYMLPGVGFVQSPQYYKNYDTGYVAGGAWEQQQVFFGAICRGKNRMNSAFMCGTNMVIRKQALDEVDGMREDNIAEDFVTSIEMHAKGWRSVYVPEILAEGLAPEDFLSYSKQQARWARGSLGVLFQTNPLLVKGLTWKQRFQYLTSSSFYLSGLVVLVNAIFPIIFFFTGATPLSTPTMFLASMFLPYIFMLFFLLSVSTNYTYTYRAMSFSLGQLTIQIKAAISALFNVRQSFSVTSKRALSGNYLGMVWFHILYILVAIGGATYAIMTQGLTAAVSTNIAWAMINCAIFGVYIVAAMPQRQPVKVAEIKAQNIQTV